MANFLKKTSMAGIPLFAVLMLCGLCYYVGSVVHGVKPNGKYVVAERSAAILEEVMANANMPPLEAEKKISAPILAVIKKYSDAGYVVVDADRDEHGFMVIAGVPAGTKDITAELRAAIKTARNANTEAPQ